MAYYGNELIDAIDMNSLGDMEGLLKSNRFEAVINKHDASNRTPLDHVATGLPTCYEPLCK